METSLGGSQPQSSPGVCVVGYVLKTLNAQDVEGSILHGGKIEP